MEAGPGRQEEGLQAVLAPPPERGGTGLRFPLIVKHPSGYGSVGMTKKSKVTNEQELREQVWAGVGVWVKRACMSVRAGGRRRDGGSVGMCMKSQVAKRVTTAGGAARLHGLVKRSASRACRRSPHTASELTSAHVVLRPSFYVSPPLRQLRVRQVALFVGSFGGALVEEFVTGMEFTVLVVEEPVSAHSTRTAHRAAM